MKKFGLVMLAATFVVVTAAPVAFAEETVGEKVQATANDAKRGVKKAANRVEEAVCMEGDVKCTAEKAGNRVIEAKDATVDGAKKIKNKVD
jgi:hypothetical protein